MALEEFVIDLCEESVNGALVVSLDLRLLVLVMVLMMSCADVLASTDVSSRPSPSAGLDRIPNMPQTVQQGTKDRLWRRRAFTKGAHTRERTTGDGAGELGVGERRLATVTAACRTSGYCTSSEAATYRRCHIRGLANNAQAWEKCDRHGCHEYGEKDEAKFK